MAKYCVAYKNDQTVMWAERTGNLARGWVRVTAWEPYGYSIINQYERLGKEYKGSIVGLFVAHDNEVTAWYDRSPRKAIDNRDKSEWLIKGFEQLINSRSSADL